MAKEEDQLSSSKKKAITNLLVIHLLFDETEIIQTNVDVVSTRHDSYLIRSCVKI